MRSTATSVLAAEGQEICFVKSKFARLVATHCNPRAFYVFTAIALRSVWAFVYPRAIGFLLCCSQTRSSVDAPVSRMLRSVHLYIPINGTSELSSVFITSPNPSINRYWLHSTPKFALSKGKHGCCCLSYRWKEQEICRVGVEDAIVFFIRSNSYFSLDKTVLKCNYSRFQKYWPRTRVHSKNVKRR